MAKNLESSDQTADGLHFSKVNPFDSSSRPIVGDPCPNSEADSITAVTRPSGLVKFKEKSHGEILAALSDDS